jgi:hypothetical protein
LIQYSRLLIAVEMVNTGTEQASEQATDEEGNNMKFFFKVGIPCYSFKDLGHLRSHVNFYRDHHDMDFNLTIDNGCNSPMNTIVDTATEGKAVYLTEFGAETLTTLCMATTAYGTLRYGEADALEDMKVGTTETEGAVSSGVVNNIPLYSVLRAVTTGNIAASVLDQDSSFRKVAVADETDIIASAGPVAIEVKVSPAIISLFLHGGLADKKCQPTKLEDQHLPRYLCQPPFNTRNMTNLTRLLDEKAMNHDKVKNARAGGEGPAIMSARAGLVATALGWGKPGNSFSLHTFYIVAYSVATCKDAPAESAKVSSIESVIDMPNTLEGDPRSVIITTKGVLHLWDVLFSGMDEVNNSRPKYTSDTETDTEAYATKAFSLLLATMQVVFGGLKTSQNWSHLYTKLCESKELSKYNLGRVLESMSWPERNFMVYEFMGAVTKLRISLLDGLGRVSATKLACMSRFPQVSREHLENPYLSFVHARIPNFDVVGEEAEVRCIALNQGPVLGADSSTMCSRFSKSVLERANQVTNTGIADFVTEFLVLAASEREKHWCGATDEEMEKLSNERRERAYLAIFDKNSNNHHLQKLHHATYPAKTLEELIVWCSSSQLSRRQGSGLCYANSTSGHETLKWLVAVLASSFYFPTKGTDKNKPDRSHSEMLILARNSGIRSLKRPLGLPAKDLLYDQVAYEFKVCVLIEGNG